MKVQAKCGIKNRFDIEVKDIRTGEVTKYQAHNIVLDAAFTRLVNFNTYFTNIHIGTGTGTLSAARTSLFTFLAQKAANTVEQVRALPTSRWVRNIVINPEEHVGQTITEVGIAYGTSSGNLCTHAFLEDAEGNPISLAKTDTMVVTIYATVYMALSADAAYSDKIRLVQPLANNEWISYLMGASYPTQQFRVSRAFDFAPNSHEGCAPSSHGQSSNIAPADWTKDAANKRVTTPTPSTRRLGVSVGNGEVRGFGLGSADLLGTFRGQFPIPGVFTSKAIVETIGAGDGVKTGFNPTWSYADISAVKIDDVAVSPADYDLAATKKGTNLFLFRNVQVLGTANATASRLTDNNTGTGTEMSSPSGHVYGIDAGANYSVNKFRVHPGSWSHNTQVRIRGSNNADFSDPVLLGTLTVSNPPSGWQEIEFTPATYRYFRIDFAIGSYSNPTFNQIQLLTAADQITFDTPPASGTITAEYTVDYVPKDSNHVLDLQCAIQYGEIT